MKKKNSSIIVRLVGVMLAISIIGMGLIAVISTVMSGSSLREQSLGRIEGSTALEASNINAWLQEQESYFASMSIDLAYEDDYSPDRLVPLLQGHQAANPDYFDVYMGFPDGTGTFATGWVPDYDGGWISYERGWYAGAMQDTSLPYVTSPYTDAQTAQLCITVSKAVVLPDGSVAGVVAADMFIDVLAGIVSSTTVGQDSYAFLTDGEGGLLIHPNEAYGPDKDDNFQKLSEIEDGQYAELWQLTSEKSDSVQVKSADNVRRYYTAANIPATGWKLYTAIPASVVNAPIQQLLIVIIPLVVIVVVVAAVLIYLMVRRIVIRPVRDITDAAGHLALGDTSIRLAGDYKGEMRDLADSFTQMVGGIESQAQSIQRIAGGDLTTRVPVRSDKDVMGNTLQSLSGSLGRMVSDIAASSRNVTSSASQIANNSQALAQGATEQASSVQELSAAIGSVAEQIQQNEQRTSRASEASGQILTNAQRGTTQMASMMEAVREINDASSSISRVIKVIEDIAFQTNILALNAAVEAARAGQHGKGFAVVADEVRTLAAKSAQAAQETTALIENSITKATEGSRIADETNQSLQTIIEGVDETVTLMQEIGSATSEQAEAIAHINTGIDQVSQVVSANAATSEESAATAQELSAEAHTLSHIVSAFHVEETGTPSRQHAPLHPSLPLGSGQAALPPAGSPDESLF